MDLDVGTISNLGQPEFWPLASKLLRKGKIMPGRYLTKEVVIVVDGGQNQKTTKTRGYKVKEMSHFVDQIISFLRNLYQNGL